MFFKINSKEEIENEKDTGHSKAISLKTLLKVSKSICKIIVSYNNENWNGSGFFLKLKLNREINCLLANFHIISQNIVGAKSNITIVLENEKEYSLKLDSDKRFIKFHQNPLVIALIEILNIDIIINDIDFLINDFNYLNGYNQYSNKNIFILQYPKEKETYCQMGKIVNVNNFLFQNSVHIGFDSSEEFIKLA